MFRHRSVCETLSSCCWERDGDLVPFAPIRGTVRIGSSPICKIEAHACVGAVITETKSRRRSPPEVSIPACLVVCPFLSSIGFEILFEPVCCARESCFGALGVQSVASHHRAGELRSAPSGPDDRSAPSVRSIPPAPSRLAPIPPSALALRPCPGWPGWHLIITRQVGGKWTGALSRPSRQTEWGAQHVPDYCAFPGHSLSVREGSVAAFRDPLEHPYPCTISVARFYNLATTGSGQDS